MRGVTLTLAETRALHEILSTTCLYGSRVNYGVLLSVARKVRKAAENGKTPSKT